MGNRCIVAIIAGLVLAVLGSPAQAQRSGSIAFVPSVRNAPAGGPRIAPGAGPLRAHRTARRHFSVGSGFWPYYFADSEPEPDGRTPESDVPPVRAIAPAPAPYKPAESLLLERHGDTWVRVSASGDARPLSGDRSAVLTAMPQPATSPPAPIPSAILVFHDGHTEEVQRYVIVGTILSTSSDYWSTGSWTRRISIADLNVPETLRLNQQRGAKFTLPSGPSEVIMRP